MSDLRDRVRRQAAYLRQLVDDGKITLEDYQQHCGPNAVEAPPDVSDWRKHCKHAGELSNKVHPFLLDGLVPRSALTMMPSPSFNGKTWLALQACKAVSEGKDFLSFGGPKDEAGHDEKVPVIYHVPEMAEYLVKERARLLGIKENDDFLFRPMELGLWPLNDAYMLESCKGRLVVLDTQGYFNPADNASDYQQAVNFAKLIYNLLNVGAVAVIGLYHPPKVQMQAGKFNPAVFEWTLENSILGSAGYGGILRSCLRVKNLNPDKNDKNLWLYVQGLKNPGLKPFTLKGIPLKMHQAPGECPYLRELLQQVKDAVQAPDPQEVLVRQRVREGKGVNVIKRELDEKFRDNALSHGTVVNRRKAIIEEINGIPGAVQLDLMEEGYAPEWPAGLVEIIEEGCGYIEGVAL